MRIFRRIAAVFGYNPVFRYTCTAFDKVGHCVGVFYVRGGYEVDRHEVQKQMKLQTRGATGWRIESRRIISYSPFKISKKCTLTVK